MTILRRLGDMVNDGTISVMDYFKYEPDFKEIESNPSNTGCDPRKFKTNLNINYRAWNVIKDSDEPVLLFADANVCRLELNYVRGFFNGPDELHRCMKEMYSCEKLGTVARSITIEDLNDAIGFVPEKFNKKYAYYAKGANAKHDLIWHNSDYYNMVEVNWNSRFFVSDDGVVRDIDEDRIPFMKPTDKKPVFVTNDYYHYCYRERLKYLVDCWLASQCVYCNAMWAAFCVRCVRDCTVDAVRLCFSDEGDFNSEFGMRPVIPLNSELYVDCSNVLNNGSTPECAWKLVSADQAMEMLENDARDTVESKKEELYKFVYSSGDTVEEVFKEMEQKVSDMLLLGYIPIGDAKVVVTEESIFIYREMMLNK